MSEAIPHLIYTGDPLSGNISGLDEPIEAADLDQALRIADDLALSEAHRGREALFLIVRTDDYTIVAEKRCRCAATWS